MSRPGRKYEPDARVRGAEMLGFLVVSAVGIYALGRGLSGLSEPGKGIDFLWLAIAGVAVWTLVTQMGRVHDAWPRRDDRERRLPRPATRDDAEASAPPAPSAREETAGS